MDGYGKFNMVVSKVLGFLKLIRGANLLIIIATLFLLKFLVVLPLLNQAGLVSQFGLLDFSILTLAIVFIAAGGNIINDYFDVKIDLLNRPDDVVVSKSLTRRDAIALHIIFSLAGVLLGTYLSYKNGLLFLSPLYLIVVVLLWFYSTTYKKQLLIGNVIVALLTGIIPFMAILYEIPLQNRLNWQEIITRGIDLRFLISYISAFSFFAFFTNLIREIIKDTEDFEGDNAFGCNTVPIKWGIKTTKIILISLISLLFFTVVFCIYKLQLTRIVVFEIVYAVVAILFPIAYMGVRIYKSNIALDYKYAGDMAKYIMLAGLLFSVIIEL